MTPKLAIIGGGPGGLFAAHHVQQKLGDFVQTSLFEASGRLGGKILTAQFDHAPVPYEAGLAEIYGYANLGPDPLADLIASFGLKTTPIDSDAVTLDGRLIQGVAGMKKAYGGKVAAAITRFRAQCAKAMSPAAYYEGAGRDDNDHEWMWENAENLVNSKIEDPIVRRFFRVMARSDIASELHLTNGLNALKNFLMDVDGYIDLCTIEGGNARLIEALAAATTARIELDARVTRIDKPETGGYRLEILRETGASHEDFDFVLIALPHNWLGTLAWGNEALRQAMTKHIAHFDRPAHYLRLAVLFKSPFWAGKVTGDWFMSEAFGGSCVYLPDTNARMGGFGVMNWLIAGADALAYAQLDAAELTRLALATLPAEFGDARPHFLESKVHPWLASVNALPGGMPARQARTNHMPEPKAHPGLFVIGDYLFDSTLNGLLDSADMATDMLLSAVLLKRYHAGTPQQQAVMRPNPVQLPPPSERIDRAYFEHYRGLGPYSEVWQLFTDPDDLIDLVRLVWRLDRRARLLVTGSASGELVGALRQRGIDAWGIEKNRFIHARTPPEWRKFNLLGDITRLPFEANAFDVIYEGALALTPRARLGRATRELFRVSQLGLYFASVTADQDSDLCDRFDLLRGVKTLATAWEWSEILFEAEFDLALCGPEALEKVWRHRLGAKKTRGQNDPGQAIAGEGIAGEGIAGRWHDDRESLLYAFYSKPTIK